MYESTEGELKVSSCQRAPFIHREGHDKEGDFLVFFQHDARRCHFSFLLQRNE